MPKTEVAEVIELSSDEDEPITRKTSSLPKRKTRAAASALTEKPRNGTSKSSKKRKRDMSDDDDFEVKKSSKKKGSEVKKSKRTAERKTSSDAEQPKRTVEQEIIIMSDDDEEQPSSSNGQNKVEEVEEPKPVLEEEAAPSTSNGFNPLKAWEEALNQLENKMKRTFRQKELKKIWKKINRRYKALSEKDEVRKDEELLKRLAEKTSSTVSQLTSAQTKYRLIQDLLTLYENPSQKEEAKAGTSKMDNDATEDNESLNDDEVDAKKERKILKLEKMLKKLEGEIQKYDLSPTDLDDDKNSAYLVKTRLVAQYMRVWKQLCALTNCSVLTGRPVQKKFKLTNVTNYPEFNTACEKYLNSQPYTFCPDYHDIRAVIIQTNEDSGLGLSAALCKAAARDMYFKVSEIKKRRRMKDLSHGFPWTIMEGDPENDPADKSPELAAQLQHNDRVKTKLTDVFESYAVKAAERGEVRKYELDGDAGETVQDDDGVDEDDEKADDDEEGDDEEIDEEECLEAEDIYQEETEELDFIPDDDSGSGDEQNDDDGFLWPTIVDVTSLESRSESTPKSSE